MKIGIIQASSQANKNQLIYSAVKKYAPKDSEIINFGCTPDEKYSYSYIDISILVGILLASEAVDFIVTGCSSGQGMMLACNSMPGVICGYAPTPKDAYLFVQINNGNAISLPLGEDYTWTGKENLDRTIEALFSEPFGQGYPKSEAARKLEDTKKLKEIRRDGQISMQELLSKLDSSLLETIRKKQDVVQYVAKYGKGTRFGSVFKSDGYIEEELTSAQIDALRQIQATLEIENMKLSKFGIEEMAKMLKGEISREEYQKELKERYLTNGKH